MCGFAQKVGVYWHTTKYYAPANVHQINVKFNILFLFPYINKKYLDQQFITFVIRYIDKAWKFLQIYEHL